MKYIFSVLFSLFTIRSLWKSIDELCFIYSKMTFEKKNRLSDREGEKNYMYASYVLNGIRRTRLCIELFSTDLNESVLCFS